MQLRDPVIGCKSESVRRGSALLSVCQLLPQLGESSGVGVGDLLAGCIDGMCLLGVRAGAGGLAIAKRGAALRELLLERGDQVLARRGLAAQLGILRSFSLEGTLRMAQSVFEHAHRLLSSHA